MINKLIAVFVLSLVFSVSSVSAKPNDNGNGKGKGHGKPKMEEEISIASATTAHQQHPKADFSKGENDVLLTVPCVDVIIPGGDTVVYEGIVMQRLGNSPNFRMLEANLAEGFIDCMEYAEFMEGLEVE